MQKSVKVKFPVLIEALICVTGLVVFSIFSHREFLPFIFSMAGLLAAAVIIVRNSSSGKKVKLLFGFNQVSGKVLIYLVISLLFGILIAVAYRKYQYSSVLPARLTYIAILAALTGSLEEIIFRGFIQGYTRQISILFSIVFAILAHTAYKCSLFMAHQSVYETNILFLMKWTIYGGIVFSILREYSNNILPPIIGHAVFDIIVYGDYLHSPWWLWS
jgi:membrane protease YdiL (CAAX protease family)